jgi:hypothetical protein
LKQLKFNGEIYEAERIVKTSDSIFCYIGGVEVQSFKGISDFSGFELLDGAEWDEPDTEELNETDVIAIQHVKLELIVLEMKKQLTALIKDNEKKTAEIIELTTQNKVLGSLLSSLQVQVLTMKGGADASV